MTDEPELPAEDTPEASPPLSPPEDNAPPAANTSDTVIEPYPETASTDVGKDSDKLSSDEVTPASNDTVFEPNPETAASANNQNTVIEPTPETASGSDGSQNKPTSSLGIKQSTDGNQEKNVLGKTPFPDEEKSTPTPLPLQDSPDLEKATYVDPNAYGKPDELTPPTEKFVPSADLPELPDMADLNSQTIADSNAHGTADTAPQTASPKLSADLPGLPDMADLNSQTITDSTAHGTPDTTPSTAGVKLPADLPELPEMVDLNTQTIQDSPLDSDGDLHAKTVVGGAMAGDIPDLTVKTLVDDLGELPDLNAATLQESHGNEPLVDFAAGTIMDPDGELEKLWNATLTDDLTEGMTIKGDAIEVEGDQGVGHASSRINVNTRAFSDLTKATGNISVQARALARDRGGPADFELIKVLGEGGMGIVYQGRQTSVDRSVAIKMIKSHAAHNKDVRDKFLAEASVTGDLDHPNIVPIHDLGANSDGALFYAMKHVRGDPWSEVVTQKTLDENLEIFLDICNALAFSHDRGVIHRDLKPENVMLGGYGEVLLMDWGLAAAVSNEAKAERLGVKASICGTPAYMSPEMAVGDGRKIGVVSDVYLMGAILYEVITGKAPHTGKTVLKCLENAALNILRETAASGELMDIALKAMAAEVEDRYQTIAEFTEAIKEYRSHIESNNLAKRAEEDLEEAEQSKEYNDYSKSVFGFQEAINLWKRNKEAIENLTKVRLAYAECALLKGDLDLAESQLVEMGPKFKELRQKVVDDRAERESQERRGRFFKKVIVGLLVVVVAIIVVAGVIVAKKNKEAKIQADLAIAKTREAKERGEAATKAEKAATKAKKDAADALIRAKDEANKAMREKALADKAKKDAAEEKRKAEAQKREADKAKKEAARQKVLAAYETQKARKAGVIVANEFRLTPQEATAWQKKVGEEFKLPLTRDIPLPSLKRPLKLILVPYTEREFIMGSPVNEQNRLGQEYQHRVIISQPFYMGIYEVTQEQWKALLNEKPSVSKWIPRRPVEHISWVEIKRKFLPALQKYAPAGYAFDLPTEAEWEYACRAGSATAYTFGNDFKELGQYCWYRKNSKKKTQPVGKKKPNAWGLYDMHGNVSEWCKDWYSPQFYISDKKFLLDPITDPQNKAEPAAEKIKFRVVRGGDVALEAKHCRSAHRQYGQPVNKRKLTGRIVGFRVVLRKTQPIRKFTPPKPMKNKSMSMD